MRYQVMVMAEIHVSGAVNEYFTTLSVAHGYVAYLSTFYTNVSTKIKTWFCVGLMPCHCLQRWPNRKAAWCLWVASVKMINYYRRTSPRETSHETIVDVEINNHVYPVCLQDLLVALVLKSGICHFTRWQIPLFNTRVTLCITVIGSQGD